MKDSTIPNKDLSTQGLKDKLASLESRMKEETGLLTIAYTNSWREAVAVRNELTRRKNNPDVVEK